MYTPSSATFAAQNPYIFPLHQNKQWLLSYMLHFFPGPLLLSNILVSLSILLKILLSFPAAYPDSSLRSLSLYIPILRAEGEKRLRSSLFIYLIHLFNIF